MASGYHPSGAQVRIDFSRTRTLQPPCCPCFLCCLSHEQIEDGMVPVADTRFVMSLRGFVSEQEHAEMMAAINNVIRKNLEPAVDAMTTAFRWCFVCCVGVCLFSRAARCSTEAVQRCIADVDGLNTRDMLARGVQYSMRLDQSGHDHAKLPYILVEIAPDAKRIT